MKNVVLCFDEGGDSSATALFCLLEQSDEQVTWYHCDTASNWRRDAAERTHTAVGAAYGFLVDAWEPGDQVFVVGAGFGGYCAHALTRLLGTVGVLGPQWTDLVDFALSAYALPRTPRTAREWWRVRHVIGDLNGGIDITVPVRFLGSFDAVRAPGLPPPPAHPPANVVAGRHAIAVGGGPFRRSLVPASSDGVEVAWFRGGHRDVAGGPDACAPLVGIAVDWMLDGVLAAGARVLGDARRAAPTPDQADALAGSAYNLAWRKLPADASVHASVEVYLRAHPDYWRRLPSRVVWADPDWLARGERLVADAGSTPAPVEPAELVAVAS